MNNTNIIIKINKDLYLSIIQQNNRNTNKRNSFFEIALLDKKQEFNNYISNKYGYEWQVKTLFNADELTKEIERIKNIYRKGK
tara:strand:+ start:452 stop:700 length:249 start_codon:yes stop_codon:yes gene_type:complete